MNKKLKQSIKKAFEAPEPNRQEKAEFLNSLPRAHISMKQFILIQATYIRKRTWLFAIALLILALFAARYSGRDTVWIISSFVPFLGLTAVAENNRSATYGMNELETATRFSLKRILLARMSILGILDAVVLIILTPLCSIGSNLSIIQTGAYLLVPYLLSVNICLWLSRHRHNKELTYECMAVSVLVSVSNTACHFAINFIYRLFYVRLWYVAAVCLLTALVYEIYGTIRQTEKPFYTNI